VLFIFMRFSQHGVWQFKPLFETMRRRTPEGVGPMSKDLVVRFAGEGGHGVDTAYQVLTQPAARVGYHVQTFATYPSQITGGPVWAQARISTEEVLTSGDELDVLVALDRYAYDNHHEELRDGGIVIYNLEEYDLEGAPNTFGIEIDRLARETGNTRASNMIMVGAVGQLSSMPQQYFDDFVRARYSRGREGDEAIIESNIRALTMGYEAAAASGLRVEQIDPPQPSDGERTLVTGYEAFSMGAIAAGLDTFIGYPISPATTTLVFMEDNLTAEGKVVVQTSSEIESIAALIGGGFAGNKTMTSTAGPGLSLMGEGLGLAWMAEIPLVVLDVQRGGPATGLPTKTEQSDLLSALTPGHGDMSIPIIAPGTITECFEAGVMGLNWAERYQGPVIVLSDMSLAERRQDIPRPDLSSVVDERRTVSDGADGNRRYRGDRVTPMPLPGGPGAYVANGSEHDEQGDTTHLSDIHVQMTNRRFSKLALLEDGSYESDNATAPVAVMTWGGSKGPALAAYNTLREQGEEMAWFYTMYLNPLPPALLLELQQKELVLVPELNYLGQFSQVLRGLGVNAHSITQYTGLPFKEHMLTTVLRERLATTKTRKLATA
jgi:2-oxoglutarate ferredoxin oxidoreductase subunit alpha